MYSQLMYPVIRGDLWLYMLAIATMAILSVATLRYRKAPGALAQAGIQGAKGLWILGIVLGSLSPNPGTKGLWFIVGQSALVATPTLAMLLLSRISRPYLNISRRVMMGFGGALLLWWLLIWSNPWLEGFWHVTGWAQGQMVITFAPMGLLVRYGSLATMAVYTLLCLLWAWRAGGLRRRQALTFALIAMAGSLGPFTSGLPFWKQVPIQPFSCLLTGLLATWAYNRWRLFNIRPLAHEVVVEGMGDGLVVVDEQGHIVELNAAAQGALAGLPVQDGTELQALLRAWPALAPLAQAEGSQAVEAERIVNESLRCFQISQTPLKLSEGRLFGRVLLFKDITQEKAKQGRLLKQEKAMSVLLERDRLGRELHDGPGQAWSFVSMQAQAALTLVQKNRSEEAAQVLERLIQVTQEVHVDLRESITGLQASDRSQNLPEAIEANLAWYRHHCGLETALIVEGTWTPGRLVPADEAQVRGIVQEALANVRKSAQARRVEIRLRVNAQDLELQVRDDGQGFDLEAVHRKPGHHGLHIMQTRALEIGATLGLTSTPGEGTIMELKMPFSRA